MGKLAEDRMKAELERQRERKKKEEERIRRSQDRSSIQEREQQLKEDAERKKREAEKLEQLRLQAMSQTASTQEKINLKYASSSAVRPGQTFGYGQVTTGQVSSRKYEILARASSVGPEDRGGLNPDLIRAQSEQRRASPAPMGKAMATSEVDASHQMMSRSQFSKQADFASTTAALSTGLTRRQTTSVSKMASSEMKSVSSMSSQQMSMSSSSQFASSSQSSSFSSVQQSSGTQ